ncbi:hypothetical protein [Bosea rubneri]|uniref:Uncharacterized protein n=1 Tax=Bosea rubneri TaxID=3075434 RepID=A0ABU3S490_9HYPH|nr:hypothetical protein [Bosea sp. ZW T0_25]MDU0339572.1 hypothetical protein [Bosea sp. ZW T0_25]
MTMRLDDLRDDGCRWCGGEIELERPHAIKRVYCSDDCRIRHGHDLVRIARIEARQNRHCERCSQPLAISLKAGTIYCSAICARDDSNEREKLGRLDDKAKVKRFCARCNEPIPASRRAEAIYCSASCKRRVLNAAWRQRSRERAPGEAPRREPVACRWCAAMFVPRRTDPTPVLCSLSCNMAERRARAATPGLLSCVICSAEYRPKAGCLPRRTCSEPCRQLLRTGSRRANRATITCEAIF